VSSGDPFDLKTLRLDRGQVGERSAAVPTKIRRRQQHFATLPMTWYERMREVRSCQTYRVAWYLLYLHWKAGGELVTLANRMLEMDGVDRFAKWRALNELERLGLIAVKRRPRKSPTIKLLVA
jgi:hypothetical protein